MRNRANPDLVVSTINTSTGDHASSKTFMAVISPCSVCKNFSSTSSTSPLCPRRYWFDRVQTDTPPQLHLIESGTEDPQKLANPVHSQKTKSVLMWVATLDNNPEVLDAGFDTINIRCEHLPVTPQESQSQLFSFGTYRQLDQVLVTSMKSHQPIDKANAAGGLVQIGGCARKVHFSGSFSLVTPKKDMLVPGT